MNCLFIRVVGRQWAANMQRELVDMEQFVRLRSNCPPSTGGSFGSQAAYFRQFYSTAAVEPIADGQRMISRKTEFKRLLLL